MNRTGHIAVASLTGLVVVAGAAIIAAKSMTTTSTTMAASADQLPVATAEDVVTVLGMAGVTPEALAIAGVDASAVSALFAAAQSHADDAVAQIRANQSDLALHLTTCDRLQRKARAGTCTDAELSDLATARQQVGSDMAERATLAAAAFTAVNAGLTQNQRTTLTALGSHDAPGVPLVYAAAGLTESELMALRDALSEKRTAEELGLDVEPEVTATIDAADAEPGVSTAKSNLNVRLSGIQSAWDAQLAALFGT